MNWQEKRFDGNDMGTSFAAGGLFGVLLEGLIMLCLDGAPVIYDKIKTKKEMKRLVQLSSNEKNK